MRRLLLIPLLISLVGCSSNSQNINAEIPPEILKTCLPAADFKGCVDALSGSQTKDQSKSGKKTKENNKICSDLKNALSIVNERLISGTSQAKLDINTNPLSDALAIAKVNATNSSSCQTLLTESQTILEMLRILRSEWEYENNNLFTDFHNPYNGQGPKKAWPAGRIILNINKFNLLAGGDEPAISGPGEILGIFKEKYQGFDYEMKNHKGGLLMPCAMYICGDVVVKSPLNRMFEVISNKLNYVLALED